MQGKSTAANLLYVRFYQSLYLFYFQLCVFVCLGSVGGVSTVIQGTCAGGTGAYALQEIAAFAGPWPLAPACLTKQIRLDFCSVLHSK